MPDGPLKSLHGGRRLSRLLVPELLALLVAACGGVVPTPARSLPPHAPSTNAPPSSGSGIAWAEAEVAQPAALVDPWASASPPSFCSPCHAGTATRILGVTRSGPDLVAVGMAYPPAHAAAWLSADGASWTQVAGLETPDGTLMTAVTAASGRVVAVGGTGAEAAAWQSSDGRTWSDARVTRPAVAGQARMSSVVGWHGGFVAGGDVEPTPDDHHAVLWSSADGSAWTPVPDAAAFDGGAVNGLAANGSLLVAVGYMLDVAGVVRGAAWVSTDGRRWAACLPDPSFSHARMNAVVAWKSGFVAVGSAADGTSAAVWTSPDGIHWRPDRNGTGFTGGIRIGMTAVAAGPGALVAVGARDDAGNGSPTVWLSTDGTTWHRMPDDASFGGGEMTAVFADGAGIVATGTLGLPDNPLAAAWLGRVASRGGPSPGGP